MEAPFYLTDNGSKYKSKVALAKFGDRKDIVEPQHTAESAPVENMLECRLWVESSRTIMSI